MKREAKFDLSGKTIVLTGAAGGIGKETALQLSSMGADLLLTDLNEDAIDREACLAEAKSDSQKILTLQHNVCSRKDWQSVLELAQNTWGRFDALLNIAGIMVNERFLSTTEDQFQRSMDINVKSIFEGVQVLTPLMIEHAKTTGAKPSIVNFSSIYGQIAGPVHVAYGASKGAVRTMSKAMASELARFGIRVNSVHPGPTNTPLLHGAMTYLSEASGKVTEAQVLAATAKAHPMGRTAEAGDIAPTVAFLCSDGSAFMTGTELIIDGGYSMV